MKYILHHILFVVLFLWPEQQQQAPKHALAPNSYWFLPTVAPTTHEEIQFLYPYTKINKYGHIRYVILDRMRFFVNQRDH